LDYRKIVTDLLISTNRLGIENLIEYLDNNGFYSSPSSCKRHGNYKGGLVIHSRFVYEILNKLNITFKRNIEQDSVIISALCHDICKLNFYIEKEKWYKDDKNKWQSKPGFEIEEIEPMGHGTKSVIILKDFITLKPFETYSILYHMGIPENFEQKLWFNTALKKYPDILLLHMADFMSTALYEATL
jgi:hypothetical protein